MTRLVDRTFRVRAPRDAAWRHLARVTAWPSWAKHIKRVELSPPGDLTEKSAGTLHLVGGITSTFKMTEFAPPVSWKWAGLFLWMTVHYDHRFHAVGEGETEINFVVDGEGFGASVLGRLFAAAYKRNLEKAIPNLIAELEGCQANA